MSPLVCCALAVLVVGETLVTIHVSWLRQDLALVEDVRLRFGSGVGSGLGG